MNENNNNSYSSPYTFKDTIRGIISTIVVILIFTCPAMELSKLILFNLTKNEITLKSYIIEFIYLGVVFTFPFGLLFTAIRSRCCNMRGLMHYIREQLCCLPFLILIIASIYTHLTSQDMKPIPDSCPSNYPYKLSITRAACLIRLINFITMWSFTSLLIILTVADCFGFFPRKEQDKTIEARLSDFFPPDRDDEIYEKGKP